MILCSLPADSYVLKGQHVLELMLKKNKLPTRLFINQSLTVYDSGFFAEASVYEQWVRYQLPEAFRTDIESEEFKQIHVVSADNSLTIIDDMVVSESEGWVDHYKDIFFYRSRAKLVNRLENLGIDFSTTSLGRLQGTICYIIGANYPDESVPQLWVAKDTFRPLRWIVKIADSETGLKHFEFLYKEWNTHHRTWYPSKIEFYEDQQMIRCIEVRQVEINPAFSKDLFDITRLKAYYSTKLQEQLPENHPNDIEKRIEDFKKIYE